MLFKNVASQKIHVYAYDSTTGAAKTGDAANITAYVSLDGTANAIDDTNPAEVDATNMPGVYVFDLAQAETNCNSFALYAKSATSNIRIEPIIGFTTGAAVTQTGDSYARLGAPAGASIAADLVTLYNFVDTEVAAILAAVDTEVAAIKAKTDSLTFTVAGKVDANVTHVEGNPAEAGVAQTGDAYARLGAPAGASHAADVAAVKADTAAVKAKTDNLPTDPADQSAVEAAITAATSVLATSANLATVAGYLDTEIAAMLQDTDELQKAWVDGGRLDLLIDAIKAKTDLMLDAAAIRTAVGLASANLDTQFSNAATNLATLDTLVDKMAPLLIGTVTGAGTATEEYVYGGVTVTVTADDDGNVSAVVFS